jgi:hypothetical protein
MTTYISGGEIDGGEANVGDDRKHHARIGISCPTFAKRLQTLIEY